MSGYPVCDNTVVKEIDCPSLRIKVNSKEAKRAQVFQRDKLKCWYCGKQLCLIKIPPNHALDVFLSVATIDHKTPLQRVGGTNEIDNLVTCCRSCNGQKGNRTVEEYRAYLSRLQALPTSTIIFYGEKVNG
jgi:5-methylcytosine-specific restriction endonuclease McrA